MIAVFRSVRGPWPGHDGPDTQGFRDAADVVATTKRRATAGQASADDLRRHRVASAAIERCARRDFDAALAVDANDLVAHLLASRQGSPEAYSDTLPTVCPPDDLALMRKMYADALAATGPFATAILEFLDAQQAAGRGVVITVQRTLPSGASVLRSPVPPSARASRTASAAPDVADALGGGPATADLAFSGDTRRLGLVAKLRAQIRDAVRTGEPLSVGAQAKHDVLTEALRELWWPAGPSGELRILHVDGSEAAPFGFAPPHWPVPRGSGVSTLRLGLMSMRHTELDADVSGYWFRNRLVSVNRPLAETDAFCEEESERQLHAVAAEGVTDLEIVHTGFEPAVTGFYRAVAAFCEHTPLRVRPQYLSGRRLIPGTTWGAPNS